MRELAPCRIKMQSKSQICEPSAMWRRTQNLSPPSRSEGGEFSHKNSIVRVPCPRAGDEGTGGLFRTKKSVRRAHTPRDEPGGNEEFSPLR